MAEKHLILCGGISQAARHKAWKGVRPIRLQLGTGKNHLHLQLHHITRKLASRIPDVAIDLLEIAAYVYATDQMVSRGGLKEFEYGEKWRRYLHFDIPVRVPEVWQDAEMLSLLRDTVGFLSDDDIEFHFEKHKRPVQIQQYLFGENSDGESEYEEVMLFSGGLDSFGGAVQEILQGRRKVVLVSHRPVSKIYARQKHLVRDICENVDRALAPLHVAVEVNKSKNLGREFTQRTRSFLFASIAAAVALPLERRRIRFYENGITSLNVPLSPQVIGGRATRTTHPQVLAGFQKIFTRAFGSSFTVENPFFWKTKTDVLREIKAAGFGHLCAHTSSCTHTKEQTKMHTHCGCCSQCVDRRLSALAAALSEKEDPPEMYAADILTGPRENIDLAMIERYVGTCLEIEKIEHADTFFKRFPELVRVLRLLGRPAAQAACDVFNLFRRHARDICHALQTIVIRASDRIIRKDYAPNCLLGITVGRSGECTPASAPICTSPSGKCQLTFDDGKFTAAYNGRVCPLHNTNEYSLLKRLAQAPSIYLSNDKLRESVWNDRLVAKNTIQRTVSNLRRRLREHGVAGIAVDGKTNRNHYALLLT